MENASRFSRSWSFFKRPAVSLALRVIVSGLLLAYLASLSAFTGIAQAFSRIRPVNLLGFFLLYFVSVSFQSLRWKLLLHAWGVERKFQVLFRSIMNGLFLNNFLPGSLGGDVYRLYTGGRETGKVEVVAATIFYERILSYFCLVTLGLVVLFLRADLAGDWFFWLLLGAALAGLVTLSFLASAPSFERLAGRLEARSLLARKLHLVTWLHSFRFKVQNPAALMVILLISFLIQFLDVSSFWVVGAAIQLPVGLRELLLFVPVLYLAILLPLSFNGIGVREAVFVMFSSMWGISSADAVAFSLTVFALNLAGSLVGGVIYWFDRPVSRQDAPPAEASE